MHDPWNLEAENAAKAFSFKIAEFAMRAVNSFSVKITTRRFKPLWKRLAAAHRPNRWLTAAAEGSIDRLVGSGRLRLSSGFRSKKPAAQSSPAIVVLLENG